MPKLRAREIASWCPMHHRTGSRDQYRIVCRTRRLHQVKRQTSFLVWLIPANIAQRPIRCCRASVWLGKPHGIPIMARNEGPLPWIGNATPRSEGRVKEW